MVWSISHVEFQNYCSVTKMDTLLVFLCILGSCTAGIFQRSTDADRSLLLSSGFETSDAKQSGFPVKWTKLESVPFGQHRDEKSALDAEDEQSDPRFEDPQHMQKIEDGNEIFFDKLSAFENSGEVQKLEAAQNGGMKKSNVSENIKEINAKAWEFLETNISMLEDESRVPKDDSNISADFAILNLTNNLIDIQFVTENISSINSMSLDETDLLREGSEIALFQETSTTGFEFLIDSETAKNLLLAELLASQEIFANKDSETTDVDELEALNAEHTFFELKDLEMELNATVPVKEILNKTEDSDILTEKDSQSELVISFDENAGPISDTPTQTLECPRPGFCLFSFFRRDACSQNSDCHGTSICCKSGCSMACVDV